MTKSRSPAVGACSIVGVMREVPITGESARRQPSEASDALAPQGTPITSPDSDSQLLTCPSTVEYHVYKVFVGLRGELGDGAMPL